MIETQAVQSYLQAVWKCRHFWISLVKSDLRARYRRSVLGIGWSLLQPLAMTTVLCIVFHKLFGMPLREFAPFLLSGLTFWSFITSCTSAGCHCFLQGEPYIRQYPAPLAIYPLRTLLGAAFHFGVALLVVNLLAWSLNGFSNLTALWSLVPALVLVLIVGWSIAVLAGFANVYFPDMQHLLDVGLQILFYATPIMYPPSMLRDRGMGWLVDYNPLGALLTLIRQPILEGEPASLGMFGVATLVALICFSLASLMLGKLQNRLIFQL
jgi:ABC-type polysaccharide/polyol phosphate export permease